jgi:hypothetical protein
MDMIIIFYYYSNLWIIYVQWPTNLPKSMWNFIFNVTNVIFQFGSPKRNVHKVHMNNALCKNFKCIYFWNKEIEKQTKNVTYENMVNQPFKSP